MDFTLYPNDFQLQMIHFNIYEHRNLYCQPFWPSGQKVTGRIFFLLWLILVSIYSLGPWEAKKGRISLKEQCFHPCLINGIRIPKWTGNVELLIDSLGFFIYSISTCFSYTQEVCKTNILDGKWCCSVFCPSVYRQTRVEIKYTA